MAQLYRSERCLLRGAFAVHLWETKVWASLLSTLTPERLETEVSIYLSIYLSVYLSIYLSIHVTICIYPPD